MQSVLLFCLLGLASAQDVYKKEQYSCTPASSASQYKKRGHSMKLFQTPSEQKALKKIYFINLESDHPRFAHMKGQCKKAAGIPCEKFKAVESKKISQMNLKEVSNGEYASWLNQGGRGESGKQIFAAIWSSNYKLLEKIQKEAENPEDVYMVLEDDSILAPDWKASFNEVLAHTPDDWEFLKVGFWGEQRCEDKVNKFVSALQYPSVDKHALGDKKHFYSGNTGYIVQAKNIPKILSIMREHNIGAIENVWMYPSSKGNQIRAYTVTAPYKLVQVTHEFGRSDKMGKGAPKNFLQKTSIASRDHETVSSLQVQQERAEMLNKAMAQVDQKMWHMAIALEAKAMSHPRAYNDIEECVAGASERADDWKPQHSEKNAEKMSVRKIYYINTQQDDERDIHMRDLFANLTQEYTALGQNPHYNLPPVERFQAVTRGDVQKHKVNLKAYSSGQEHEYMKKYLDVTRDVTKAIWLSHAKVLEHIDQESRKKKMKSHDDDVYVVLEDDTFMDTNWNKRLQQMIQHTPEDWDMLKLGYWGNRHCIDKVNKFIYQANGPTFSNEKLFYQGNSGYAVKRGSLKKILANLKSKRIMDIDGAFLTSPQDCKEDCIKVYAAAGDKQIISDINLGTMRVPTKKNGLH